MVSLERILLVLPCHNTRRQTLKSDSQVDPILSVEAGAVTEIKTTTNHVVRSESRPVSLTSAGAAEAVTIISVISVTLLVPARQSVHVHPLGRESHAHVAVSTLGDYLDLEVIEAARGWNGIYGPN